MCISVYYRSIEYQIINRTNTKYFGVFNETKENETKKNNDFVVESRLAEMLSFVVFDPFADLFITLCIVVNTFFMALDQHDMDPGMESALKNGNYVST